VTLKAGEVFEIAMLAHGTPPLVQTRLIAAPANYHGFRHSGSRKARSRQAKTARRANQSGVFPRCESSPICKNIFVFFEGKSPS
jgi:hypothetical protein